MPVAVLKPGNGNHVGIYFGRVVIVHVAGAGGSGRSGNGGIDGMLVRPSRVAARGVDHAVNGIRTDEIPGVNGVAAIERIAHQLVGIDG